MIQKVSINLSLLFLFGTSLVQNPRIVSCGTGYDLGPHMQIHVSYPAEQDTISTAHALHVMQLVPQIDSNILRYVRTLVVQPTRNSVRTRYVSVSQWLRHSSPPWQISCAMNLNQCLLEQGSS
jgi:hypothetical protein